MRFNPTRLVRIERDSEGQIHAQVTHFSSDKGPVEYLTLSHRWGGQSGVKLTTQNLDDIGQEIPFQDLSRTFRHAMTAALRLGWEYLWIDALCVIQDSSNDWEREAALMSEVYKHSSCNLAATDSEMMGQGTVWYEEYGLFYGEDAKRQPSLEIIESRWSNTVNDTMVLVDVGFWEHDWADMPLNSRGWVVQERILAP